MSIRWNADAKEFHLRNDGLSYILKILEDGLVAQLHFGPPLPEDSTYGRLLRRETRGSAITRTGIPCDYGPDTVRSEYPAFGSGDFRIPAVTVERGNDPLILRPAYYGHRLVAGKPPLQGLPSTYAEKKSEAETLELFLRDEPAGLEIVLSYTIFRDYPVVTRSVRVKNSGSERRTLTCVMSACIDFPDGDWVMVNTGGAWAREFHVAARHLARGRQSVSSSRGVSSHQQNPCCALVRNRTTEDYGEAYGFALVYSGNFLSEIELDSGGTARLRMGINPEHFRWILDPGEEFTAPEVVCAYSGCGLGGMSSTFHDLFGKRLIRGAWRDRPAPLLINNWEATYFDFTEEKLYAIAEIASQLGIELFVLDDGWFGRRDDDTSSLGDWKVNRKKLASGLDGFARRIERLGMKFGLWIEPEMISPDSCLYGNHPDWAVGVPGIDSSVMRNQLVLDLTRLDVIDYLYRELSALFHCAPVSYVKWDMNRYITEPFSRTLPAGRQGEFFHRYVLGLYELHERLTKEFPDILFESCAGGGGRFDAGMLSYAPQTWTSDDSDAVERLFIQWGASLWYPLRSMGAHVSAVPNHQVGRLTPLGTRAAVALFGATGYELDVRTLSDYEMKEISGQIEFILKWRETIQFGRFYRLRSPFEGDRNEAAWMVVSSDGRKAVAAFYRILNKPNPCSGFLRLRGLDEKKYFTVSAISSRNDAEERNNSGLRSGTELMNVGLLLGGNGAKTPGQGDFRSWIFTLEAV